jgi:hypothetical protein
MDSGPIKVIGIEVGEVGRVGRVLEWVSVVVVGDEMERAVGVVTMEVAVAVEVEVEVEVEEGGARTCTYFRRLSVDMN